MESRDLHAKCYGEVCPTEAILFSPESNAPWGSSFCLVSLRLCCSKQATRHRILVVRTGEGKVACVRVRESAFDEQSPKEGVPGSFFCSPLLCLLCVEFLLNRDNASTFFCSFGYKPSWSSAVASHFVRNLSMSCNTNRQRRSVELTVSGARALWNHGWRLVDSLVFVQAYLVGFGSGFRTCGFWRSGSHEITRRSLLQEP